MKVLFIGGTGIISTACTRLAAEKGIKLWILHRGNAPRIPPPESVGHFLGDIRCNPDQVADLLRGHCFDAVVDWVAYTPEDIRKDVEIFSGKTGHFLFISSASVYQRPVPHYLITEGTSLANPFWDYARQKIACENELMSAFRETSFPATIIRPSYTYGPTSFPLVVNSREHPYTVADRMLRGKEIIVPGDGTSLWSLTFHADFALGLIGLLGNSPAIGQAFHITSDEVLTWDQIYLELGKALGVKPRLVHLPSELIAAAEPHRRGGLLGDKACSVVFDNSKIKRFVPGFQAATTWAQGVRIILDWYQADPGRCKADAEANLRWDGLLEAYADLLRKVRGE